MNKPAIQFLEGTEDGPARLLNVPCFRSGKYPQGVFTSDNCKEMVANYDPAWLEAPLTPDHLQEGPAWGWFTAFRTVDVETAGGKMETEIFGDVDLLFWGEFAWKSGAYKRRSIEFYNKQPLPNGKSGFYIKAVSLLGAMTPAVKGLRNMFTEADPEKVDSNGKKLFFDLAREDSGSVATFSVDAPELEIVPAEALQNPWGFGAAPNSFGSPGGMPFPVIAYPPEAFGMNPNQFRKEPNDMNKAANTTENPEVPAGNPAGNPPAAEPVNFMEAPEVKAKFAEYDKLIAEANERANAAEAKSAEESAKAFRVAEDKRFNDCIAENRDKVSPAQARIAAAIFHALPADTADNATLKFSETDGEESKETTLRGLFLSLLSNGAKVIDLNPELKSGEKPAANFGDIPEHDTPEWFQHKHKRALAIMEKDPAKFAEFLPALEEAERQMLSVRPRPKIATS